MKTTTDTHVKHSRKQAFRHIYKHFKHTHTYIYLLRCMLRATLVILVHQATMSFGGLLLLLQCLLLLLLGILIDSSYNPLYKYFVFPPFPFNFFLHHYVRNLHRRFRWQLVGDSSCCGNIYNAKNINDGSS
jgi:hypothetical protein